MGDAVLLGSTVAERGRPSFGKPGKHRLPFHLRRELLARGLFVFNPRGLALRNVPVVQEFLGLLLESIDPAPSAGVHSPVQAQARLTDEARDFLMKWCVAAQALLSRSDRALTAKVARWRRLAVDGRDEESEWPILDLCYSFLPWFPVLQDDPAAQVYLEAITRTVAAASTFSGYKATSHRDDPHRVRSVQSHL